MARVTVLETRALGYCVRGQRRWFEKHGFSFTDFLRHGIEAAELRKTGDALGIAAAEMAENKEQER